MDYSCLCMNTYVDLCLRVLCVCVYVLCVCLCAYLRVSVSLSLSVCVCVSVCLYVCLCAYLCVFVRELWSWMFKCVGNVAMSLQHLSNVTSYLVPVSRSSLTFPLCCVATVDV